jgi:hypothetical protein
MTKIEAGMTERRGWNPTSLMRLMSCMRREKGSD